MASTAQQKTVLITGCTPGGIGHALAVEFTRRGCTVFGTVRSDEAAKALSEGGITALPLEVTSEESIQVFFGKFNELCNGELDILINNVGVTHTMPVLDLKPEDVRRVFDINLFSIIRLVQIFAPLLIKSQGTIANIGSVAGIIPYVFGGCYNASKAALHSYTDALRIELAPFKVQVVLVVTAGVKSRISDVKKRLPAESLYMPNEEGYLFRQGNSQKTAMATEDYARKVVSDLLRPATSSWLWRGHQASLVRWLWWLMPMSFWDNYFSKKFGLHKLCR